MNVVFLLRDGRRVVDPSGNPDVALEILGGVLHRTNDSVVFDTDDGGRLEFLCRHVNHVEIDFDPCPGSDT